MDERQKQLQKIRDIAEDFHRFTKTNLCIKTKSGEIIPLELNTIQKVVVETVLTCLEEGRPIRLIILKARQEGVSTIVEALIYWWTVTHKNTQSKIIAHDTKTAEKLYNMFKRYYDNSNPIFKLSTKYVTRNDLTFDNDVGTGFKSQIDTGSAETLNTGRGDTINWLHASEVAMWRNGAELVSGLMQAVPLLPNTAIFLESTANGVGDFFHGTWQSAKQGESSFTPLFFGWDMHDEYQLPVYPGFTLTKEEKQLKKEHHLKDEQLVWRREKMKEFVTNQEKFFQEYPLTDAEAFLASGTPRFNIMKLIKMEEKTYTPQTYELLETAEGITPKLVGNAPLKVWEQPQDAHQYVIGADVSEGINQDFSVATIVDKANHKVVARWRGDVQPADFGEVLEQLGRWYNRALIGVEINNHGLTTVQRLRDMVYDNLYRQEKGLDERYEEYTSRLGWSTNMKTKPLMIDGLAEAIAKDQIIDFDLIAIREYMTYITDERGKTNAQVGCHDDCVMSTAIAFQLFEWTEITKQRYEVKSRLPQKYLEIKKKNSTLIKKKLTRTYA